MRASTILQNLRLRLRRPSAWGVTAAYGGIFLLAALIGSGWKPMPFLKVVYPFLLSVGYGFLSSPGWHWTGDDRMAPGFARGLAQSVVWAFLVLSAEAGFYLLFSNLDGRQLRSFLGWTASLHWPLMVLVGLIIAQGERSEESRREALAQAREAQWNLLRSQLSPHFLFNAISAFVELGRRDWPATERGLLALAEIYRNLLDLSERPETTLREERLLVERYLAVESLRLGPRLKVEWRWDEHLDGRAVPPLLLLPLVENAVKHGLEPHAEGGHIRITLQHQGSFCGLEVANSGAWGELPRKPSGIGLRNLRARLHIAYANQATLSLERQGEWTRATLRFPLQLH